MITINPIFGFFKFTIILFTCCMISCSMIVRNSKEAWFMQGCNVIAVKMQSLSEVSDQTIPFC